MYNYKWAFEHGKNEQFINIILSLTEGTTMSRIAQFKGPCSSSFEFFYRAIFFFQFMSAQL